RTFNSLLLLVPYPREALTSFKANANLWEAGSHPSNLTKTLLTSLELSLFGVSF
ncbi:hypothetical protein TorRG33x02_175190, partial [Trema orientale]